MQIILALHVIALSANVLALMALQLSNHEVLALIFHIAALFAEILALGMCIRSHETEKYKRFS
jgi:hypothetical protein